VGNDSEYLLETTVALEEEEQPQMQPLMRLQKILSFCLVDPDVRVLSTKDFSLLMTPSSSSSSSSCWTTSRHLNHHPVDDLAALRKKRGFQTECVGLRPMSERESMRREEDLTDKDRAHLFIVRSW
jgi:hypothetical protein